MILSVAWQRSLGLHRYVAPIRIGDLSTRPLDAPLVTAVSLGDEKTVKRLLDSGSSPDSTKLLGKNGINSNIRMAAINEAAAIGNVRILQQLLDHGVDVNARGLFGLNAVSQAAMFGHSAAVKLLIQHGADVNSQCVTRLRPLNFAKDGLVRCKTATECQDYRETIAALEDAGGRESRFRPVSSRMPAWWPF